MTPNSSINGSSTVWPPVQKPLQPSLQPPPFRLKVPPLVDMRTKATPIAHAAAEGVATKTLTLGQTISAIREQLQDPQTLKVVKGLAMQYGPDLAMPVLLSVPILGWGAGCAAMPFAWWFGRKGEKIVETEQANLTKDHPVRYALKIRNHWNNHPEGLTEKLKKNYNRLIDKLFHKENATAAALRKTLHIGENTLAHRQLDRLVQAREAFHKWINRSWIFSIPFKALEWLYRRIPVLPRFLKMVALLPKFLLIALFYILGKRP